MIRGDSPFPFRMLSLPDQVLLVKLFYLGGNVSDCCVAKIPHDERTDGEEYPHIVSWKLVKRFEESVFKGWGHEVEDSRWRSAELLR